MYAHVVHKVKEGPLWDTSSSLTFLEEFIQHTNSLEKLINVRQFTINGMLTT